MEFLIAKGFRHNKKKSLIKSLKGSLTFKDEKEELIHEDDDFFLFSHGAPLQVDNNTNELYLFDGHVFYKNIFLHPFLDVKAKQINDVYTALENKEMNEVSGIFCTAKINLKEKDFVIYCDPLSQYPIASWEFEGKYVVSNNVLLIEKFLQFHKYKLKRDPLCMLRNAIAVLNVSLTTPFKDVFFQPPYTALHGGSELIRKELFTWDYLCSPPASYEECIDIAADRLKAKCNALIEAMPEYYIMSDLTGGIDSRMILAALQASGNSDVVEFWCNLRYPHPDGNVADCIIDKYQLRQGTTLLNTINEGLNIEQSIKRGLFRNRGARYKDWSGLGEGYFPKQVRLNGSFGEIGRSNVLAHVFNDMDNSVSDFTTFKDKTIQFMEKVGGLDLITEAGKNEIAQPIQDMVVLMNEMGIHRDRMSDIFYIDGRGRYHFGHYFSCNNGLFISPCLSYDINLIWANVHLNSEQRFAGKAQFDLIRILGGDELTEVPLADKRWAESILPPEVKEKLKNVEIITRHSEALSDGKNTMSWKNAWVKKKPNWMNFIKYQSLAKKFLAKINLFLFPTADKELPDKEIPRACANFIEYQTLASKLLDDTDGSESIFEYVDREKLRALTKADPTIAEDGGWSVWALHVVVAGIMWDLGQEDRTPISVKYEGEYPA